MVNISGQEHFLEIYPIKKGWSNDKKYYIVHKDRGNCLLRISDIQQYNRKSKEFQILKDLAEVNVRIPIPWDFGISRDGEHVYMLLSWVEGKDLDYILPALSKEEQYCLGLEAGKILRLFHEKPVPVGLENWEFRFNKKIDRKIKGYFGCPLRMDGDNYILDYIEENRNLLKNRPQTFQHGDYHCGNMIMDKDKGLGIIDFNRFDYGDPWEEFNRIVWCAEISPYFASGRINGYFEGNIPELFFYLLALYISANALGSLGWAITFGQSEIETMTAQAAAVLQWFDDMKNPVPNWYLSSV